MSLARSQAFALVDRSFLVYFSPVLHLRYGDCDDAALVHCVTFRVGDEVLTDIPHVMPAPKLESHLGRIRLEMRPFPAFLLQLCTSKRQRFIRFYRGTLHTRITCETRLLQHVSWWLLSLEQLLKNGRCHLEQGKFCNNSLAFSLVLTQCCYNRTSQERYCTLKPVSIVVF